jgi:hypothetical protein
LQCHGTHVAISQALLLSSFDHILLMHADCFTAYRMLTGLHFAGKHGKAALKACQGEVRGGRLRHTAARCAA